MSLNSEVRKHFTLGYTESQKVIQFQDVKASGVLGFSSLLFGSSSALAKWILEYEVEQGVPLLELLVQNRFVLLLLLLSYGAMVFFTYHSVKNAFESIRPSLPGDHNYYPSLLFFCHDDSSKQKDYLSLKCKRMKQADKSEAEDLMLDDYAHQAEQIGRILGKKINAVDRAIDHLRNEFKCAIAFSMITIIFWIFAS